MRWLEIPQELLDNVEYDENSPSGLIWIKVRKKAHRINVGGVAGTKNKVTGYWSIGFQGKQYYCHRVVYKLHNKINIQNTEIDHHDQDKDNNTIENLRIATGNEQQWNQRIRITNTSGIKGVTWDKQRNKWRARIGVNGNTYNLGSFENKYEAEKVAIKAREELHGEFACHGENNKTKPKTSAKLTIFDI